MTEKISVTISDIEEAAQRITPYIKKTPLYHAKNLEKAHDLHFPLYLKLENEQVTQSFKPRGAFNALQRLIEIRGSNIPGVVSRSSGNFAQGLAYAGKTLNVPITIVMPETAPKIKIQNTQSHGATVILKGTRHEEAQAEVDRLVKENGLIPLHPYDLPDVISGQGTAGLEIATELSELGAFFCPISGGGLMSGCVIALKEHFPHLIAFSVEPEEANDYVQARKTGAIVTLHAPKSIADGLKAPRVGDYNFPILNRYVDHAVSVSDAQILDALKTLYTHENIKAEPSGTVSLAALLAYKSQTPPKKPVVIMISGGNLDEDVFQQALQMK